MNIPICNILTQPIQFKIQILEMACFYFTWTRNVLVTRKIYNYMSFENKKKTKSFETKKKFILVTFNFLDSNLRLRSQMSWTTTVYRTMLNYYSLQNYVIDKLTLREIIHRCHEWYDVISYLYIILSVNYANSDFNNASESPPVAFFFWGDTKKCSSDFYSSFYV